MAEDELPTGWEALPHSARVRKAIELGRRSRSDAAAAQQLRDWAASGGFTLRLLAAFAGHGSRDSAAILALTGDRSRIISRVALTVLCHIGDDDSLLKALRDLPPLRLGRTLFRLRRRRPAVVDRFIAERADAGDGAAWPLVPLGSAAVLDRHLDPAAERGGPTFWRRLATLHPARAAAEMTARLDRTANPDGLLFAAARTVIRVVARRDPDAAMGVVASLRRHVPLGTIPLDVLTHRRPAAVADLVLGSSEPAEVDFSRVGAKLDVAQLVRLFRRNAGRLRRSEEWYAGLPRDHPKTDWVEEWFARLPAADRAAVYGELAPAWTNDDGLIAASIIKRLPDPMRQAEARRVAARPVLATRPSVRLAYIGLLPWNEARAEVTPWLASPEAEHRSAALAALGEATRFDSSRLGDWLALLTARRYEQDPVRQGFLDALSTLPPGRWQAEHLPGLTQIIRDALDAGDLSMGSVAALVDSSRRSCRFIPSGPSSSLPR